MGALSIRNIDDAVIDGLKRRAQSKNVSMEQEVRSILESAIDNEDPYIRKMNALAAAEKLRIIRRPVPTESVAEFVRRERDELDAKTGGGVRNSWGKQALGRVEPIHK